MTPTLEAISEAHRWTQGPKIRGQIVVHHPNGVELNLTWSDRVWFIRRYAQPANLYSNGFSYIADIPRASPAKGLAGAIADTLRVAGPEPRAQLDRVLQEIRLWSIEQPQCPGRVFLLRQEGLVSFGQEHRLHLPDTLQLRLRRLHAIFIRDGASEMMNNTAHIVLQMPATAHERLALRAQLAALPPLEAPQREDAP